MRRLRHPIRAIREPFGTAGLIVAMIALVAALGGTAFAAAKLNSTQKKEVEKIAKKFAGKPGANGAPGAQGPAGAAGKDGANGAGGAPGNPGASVTNTPIAANPGNQHCTEGGAEFKVGAGAPTYACNGTAAAGGGFAEVLPHGKTERGAYSVRSPAAGTASTTISFPVPLEAAPTATYVTLEEQQFATVPAACIVEGVEGTAENPLAAPGQLCVFAANEQGIEGHLSFSSPSVLEGEPGAGKTGVIVNFTATGANQVVVGSWAATATE